MNQDRNYLPAFYCVLQDSLSSACLAKNDGIDRLKMARIGSKINFDFLALLVTAGGLIPKMIFYIATCITKVRVVLVTELVKEDLERFL